MDTLLSVHDVAAIMQIHHKKVQRLARTGVLPCIKIGAVYRFRAEALKKWMDKLEVSERINSQEEAQGRKSGLGVQVSGLGGSDEAEDSTGIRISKRCLRQSGTPIPGLLP